ncbi:pyrimidine 5'-nucleotidase [Aquisalinus flavus]|uniref:Pyrimidine 5'-nucleotidase n=1 Tax=Aquisalinus flavus TaxID=1526572 RepID=A0A8J2Y4B2_9PROT|nr:pyrimidine 5'-nucleotidase [Aquisalinus flavus]MBD0425288.1 pyrimidine 5'-nucleotidase [Aquisalinus flavus]UNE49059.1 pyrimidine 5'-nucleotidase [Aquisalinus flavus]GGD17240.1 pyrimidine 5'-nucleotidase [Aquisalinus flavus]
MTDFTHIDTWVFDLDNTLYPAHCHLFSQIDRRMSEFIQARLSLDEASARKIQKHYYSVYGTTLSGLMKEHDMPPRDFLDYVHDIDVSVVPRNEGLRTAISALPGKRYIFTNGSVRHAENVAGKIGVLDLFDDIFDIEAADYLPKPHEDTYTAFNRRFGITPSRAAMFEDLPQNLVAAHALGKTTVLVQSDADWMADEPADKRPSRPGETFDHVHHVTADLTSFLTGLKTAA